MSQQYRMIEGHPEESMILSQIQSLHILIGLKLNSVADTITIFQLANQLPNTQSTIISQNMEPAGRLTTSYCFRRAILEAAPHPRNHGASWKAHYVILF